MISSAECVLASRNFPTRAFLACLILLSGSVAPATISPANADVLGDLGGVAGDIWGIATDPLKLGQGSQNILESVRDHPVVLPSLRTISRIDASST
jgi:hypothetical protein